MINQPLVRKQEVVTIHYNDKSAIAMAKSLMEEQSILTIKHHFILHSKILSQIILHLIDISANLVT
jgi:hypothetical protein